MGDANIRHMKFVCYPENVYSVWPAWVVTMRVCASDVDPGSYEAKYWCKATSSKAAVYTAAFLWKKWEKHIVLEGEYSRRPQVEDCMIAEKITENEYRSAWSRAKQTLLRAETNPSKTGPQAFVFWETEPEYWRTCPAAKENAHRYLPKF